MIFHSGLCSSCTYFFQFQNWKNGRRTIISTEEEATCQQSWRSLNQNELANFTDKECLTKFRITKHVVEETLEDIGNDLAVPTQRNNPVPPDTKVLES